MNQVFTVLILDDDVSLAKNLKNIPKTEDNNVELSSNYATLTYALFLQTLPW